MMLKLALAVLLTGPDEAASFHAVVGRRPATAAASAPRPPTALLAAVDGLEGIGRRDALARLAAAAAATLAAPSAALAEDEPSAAEPSAVVAEEASSSQSSLLVSADDKASTEFSESPTSDATIARSWYDGKGAPPPAPEAEAPEAEAPAEAKASSSSSDFDGNEAGSVGSTDEGSQPSDGSTIVNPYVKLPDLLAGSDVDPRYLAGGAVAVATLAVLNEANVGGEEYATSVEEEKAAAWKLDLPTPYGVQNPSGKNPFLTEVLEYCEGGKVSEECAEALKEYADDIAVSGAVATKEEAKAIAGYLGSLGGSGAETEAGKKAGAAFTTYLDALSEGSAPPPTSAKAVKSYLETLTGDAPPSVPPAVAAKAKPKEQPASEPISMAKIAKGEVVLSSAKEEAKEAKDWKFESPIFNAPSKASAQPAADLSAFDDRLTSVEGRVAGLETKVDRLPDLVYEKVETLQTRHEERMGDEVRRIVEALSTPPAAPAAAPAAPVAVAEPAPEPEPIVVEEPAAPEPEPQPTAPVVYGNPVGEIPNRGGMPQSGSAPKKGGFGFGGGAAAWKVGKGQAPQEVTVGERTIVASAPSEPETEAATEPPAAASAPAQPLPGAIPDRSGMPGPSSSGPRAGYGFGGKASWKTGKMGP